MRNLSNEQKAVYAVLADNTYWDIRYGIKKDNNDNAEIDTNNSNWTPVPEN